MNCWMRYIEPPAMAGDAMLNWHPDHMGYGTAGMGIFVNRDHALFLLGTRNTGGRTTPAGSQVGQRPAQTAQHHATQMSRPGAPVAVGP